MKAKIYRLKGTEGQTFLLPANSKLDDYEQMMNRANVAKHSELYEEVTINGLGMEYPTCKRVICAAKIFEVS